MARHRFLAWQLGSAWALFLSLLGMAPAHAGELVLRDLQMAQTADGRQLLKYLVNCALPPGSNLVFSVDGTDYSLPGALGLAPAWSTQALTEKEERRISGCILARTNFYGVPVQLSMRSDAPDLREVLQADGDERTKFSFFEAGFFGNLFKAEREAYVCTGDEPENRERHLASLLRVCSLVPPGPGVPADLSRCGFTRVGSCGDNKVFQRHGHDYTDDVIQVYLPAPAP